MHTRPDVGACVHKTSSVLKLARHKKLKGETGDEVQERGSPLFGGRCRDGIFAFDLGRLRQNGRI